MNASLLDVLEEAPDDDLLAVAHAVDIDLDRRRISLSLKQANEGGVATEVEVAGMRRALHLATAATVPHGPNPRVGCVLIDADGRTLAEGYHRGAGTPHAEVDALRQSVGVPAEV